MTNTGASAESLKRKKKKAIVKDENTQVSFKKLKKPDFDSLVTLQKSFWAGDTTRGPFGEDLKMQRKSIGVLVKGENSDTCPAPVMSLDDPCLPQAFGQVFSSLGLKTLTAVQMQCWPAILAGLNVLAIAPTGSGKTFAYGLTMAPHIQHQLSLLKGKDVNVFSNAPYGLVLVPTRELAIQVAAALKPLRKLFAIRAVPVYGGQDRETQLHALFSGGTPHIIVATPGRLLDLAATNQIVLSKVTYLVLDEADRMLSMGFFDQLDAISAQVRPDRQSLLFSATFPGKLREASANWVENAVTIRCSTFEITSDYQQIEVANEPSSDRTVQAEACGDGSDGASSCDVPVSVAKSSKPPSDAKSSEPERKSDSLLTISRSVLQHVHLCATHKKPRLLIKHIERIRSKEKELNIRQPGSVLIFCTKIKTLNFVVDFLKRQDVKVRADM